jgi:SanA protein
MLRKIKSFFKWFFTSRFKRWIFLYTPLLLIAVVFFSNQVVVNAAKGKLFNRIEDLPARATALVFGTSPGRPGRENPYYKYRMETTAALWKSGKIKHIIVSGDNSTLQYDESTAMQKDLIALGVPDSVITLDYAGFRTLDSVVRCKWVFGQSDIIIISQQFQNERAIFIANHFGINAVALNAQDVRHRFFIGRTKLREYFARVAALLDIYVLGTKPKFPGPPQFIRE